MSAPRHAGRVLTGASILVVGAMAGALWVTLGGAGGSAAPDPQPTVTVQQAASTSTAQPTTTITVTKAAKPKAPAVKPNAKVNKVTAQDAAPDPGDTQTDDAPPINGGGTPGQGSTLVIPTSGPTDH